MAIEWNKVTRLSQGIAIVLFVGVFAVGFWLGTQYARSSIPTDEASAPTVGVIGDATYQCAEGKSMHALYYDDKVTLMLSDGRTLNLGHTVSGSGVRYASEDDAIVFWNKGNTAFLTEGGEHGTPSYADCTEAPIPQ